jgi:hypothetical protein
MPCPANDLGIVEPFVAIENSEASAGSTVSVDGACVLVARSGTACRAPTERNKKGGGRESASGVYLLG